jgi:hypothetical protein
MTTAATPEPSSSSPAVPSARLVSCADRKFAQDLIDQRMMQWLLQEGPGWSFEVNGAHALCYCKRTTLAVAAGRQALPDLVALLEALHQFCDHIPSVVYDLYGDPDDRHES